MHRISFGTSGWRGLIAEDFTFDAVRAVSQAIADHLRAGPGESGPFIVAHDTRFLAEEFAHAVAEVLAGNGLAVVLSLRPYPTPAVAWEILHRHAIGAVNLTASHNPYPWNGLKFSPATGGPALPETTAAIEARANEILAAPASIRRATAAQWEALVREEILGDAYLSQLRRLIDVDVLRATPAGRIVVDVLYGTSAGMLDHLLRESGLEVTLLHAHRDPYFGGSRPDPEGETLRPLADAVRREHALLGLATDCDADRFGIVDRDGTHVVPNQILALLLDYLAQTRNWRGQAVGRSVATTHLIDAVAEANGLRVIETPVGFKYLGDLLIEKKIVMGGEESGGFSMAGHVPDKDGILTCLLVTEMVLRRGRSLREQLADLFGRVGARHTLRRDLPWSGGRAALDERLEKLGAELAGRRIERTVTTDGRKLILADGSWLLARASGTEPIVRIYVEAAEEKVLPELLEGLAAALSIPLDDAHPTY